MRFKQRFAFVLLLLTGCAGLIGVPDLTLQEEPDEAGSPIDGSNVTPDGQVHVDGGTDGTTPMNDAKADSQPQNDAGTDAATCDLTKTATDPLNCGACGHVCLDDAGCSQSTCGASILTTIEGNIGLTEMIESGDFLYGATDTAPDSDKQGVYRINKTTGAHSLYAQLRRAQKLAVVGDYLWISGYDTLYDPDDPAFSNGGIYRCKIVPGDTCAVELVTPVAYAEGLTSKGTYLYYADYGKTELRKLDTTASFIPDGGSDAEVAITKIGSTTELNYLYELFVDPPNNYYFLDEYNDAVVAYKLNGPAFSSATSLGQYAGTTANAAFHGNMVGTANSVYWASADYYPGTEGVVKRINRADNDKSCDLGNHAAGKNQVIRPQGMFVDDKNVYWTNRGEWGPAFSSGSVAMCPVDTCCTEATLLWTGSGQPWAVVGDSKHVYWSVYNGGDIYRTTKP